MTGLAVVTGEEDVLGTEVVVGTRVVVGLAVVVGDCDGTGADVVGDPVDTRAME